MSRRNSSSEDTPTPEREEINQPRIILCEGKADSVFLKALLSQRRLYGFQISEPAHGNRDFTRRLNAIKVVGDSFLRVTSTEEADYILIITVTPRRNWLDWLACTSQA